MSYYIDENKKIMLIHIPKCGGTYILKHSTFMFQKITFDEINSKDWSAYYKISLCRHPIERFISAFKMFKFGNDLQKQPQTPDLTVDLAIDILLDKSIGFENKPFTYENFKHHAIPITHPYNCVRFADDIIRFENYAEDVTKYLSKYIEYSPKKINHTDSSIDVSLNYQQKNKLHNYYMEDFQTFKYEM